MRKLSIGAPRIPALVAGVVLVAISSASAGITFTESWDSYAAGGGPGGPWFTDSHSTGPLPVSSTVSLSPGNSLQVHNNALLSNLGISALLTTGLNPGEVIRANNANPLTISNMVHYSGARASRDGSWYIEFSLGDVHAPDVAYPFAPLPNPIPVLAYTGGFGDNGKNYDYFNGQTWVEAGFSGDSGWEPAALTMIVKGNTVDLKDTLGGISANIARAYLGNFDRVNIRVTTEQGSNVHHIDDLSITGGVVVPEPTCLVSLGLGALPLLRRRRA